jgi:hypothetical protein
MILKLCTCLLLTGVLVAVPASRALAEIAVADSIEWAVRDSDWVLKGKVVAVKQATAKNGKACEVLTVAVAKTLKGTHAEQATFVLPDWIGPIARDWQTEGNEMLFCLVRRDRHKDQDNVPATAEWVIRTDHIGPCAVMLGKTRLEWPRTMGVFTRDFRVLTDPKAITKHVENAIAAERRDAPAKSHAMDVPVGSAVFEKLWGGSAVLLVVPVDEQLEAAGRKLCASREYFDRVEGVKILRQFKNAKNIDILRSLLDDPNFSTEEKSRTVPGKAELELVYRKRVYEVRRLAYEALRDFDVRVDMPVIEIPLK